jgi:sulfur-oxidizing protein SoxA
MGGRTWKTAAKVAAFASIVGVFAAGCDAGPEGAIGSSGQGGAPLDVESLPYAQPWTRYAGWLQGDWSQFNTLNVHGRTPAVLSEPAAFDATIPGNPAPGDPARGKELVFARKVGGGCLACHVMGPDTPELPGNVGPDLSEIGARGLDPATLYQTIYDARAFNPDTLMPPWGALGMFNPDEIRDMVAFLQTLKTPATLVNPLDDPARRPEPVETRDGMDPFVNPAAARIEFGAALWAEAGPNGKSCATCHAEPAKSFKSFAATMPKWEPRLEKVLGVEEFVFRHGRATTGASHLMQGATNTDLAIYLRALAMGEKVRIASDDPATAAALAEGKQLTELKIGQMNFSCVDCHDPGRGAKKWLRGQWLGEMRGQLPHFPVYRTSRNQIWDITKRIQWCNVSVRANELPPGAPEHGLLELYLAKLSEGLPLDAPGIRH